VLAAISFRATPTTHETIEVAPNVIIDEEILSRAAAADVLADSPLGSSNEDLEEAPLQPQPELLVVSSDDVQLKTPPSSEETHQKNTEQMEKEKEQDRQEEEIETQKVPPLPSHEVKTNNKKKIASGSPSSSSPPSPSKKTKKSIASHVETSSLPSKSKSPTIATTPVTAKAAKNNNDNHNNNNNRSETIAEEQQQSHQKQQQQQQQQSSTITKPKEDESQRQPLPLKSEEQQKKATEQNRVVVNVNSTKVSVGRNEPKQQQQQQKQQVQEQQHQIAVSPRTPTKAASKMEPVPPKTIEGDGPSTTTANDDIPCLPFVLLSYPFTTALDYTRSRLASHPRYQHFGSSSNVDHHLTRDEVVSAFNGNHGLTMDYESLISADQIIGNGILDLICCITGAYYRF